MSQTKSDERKYVNVLFVDFIQQISFNWFIHNNPKFSVG